MDSFQYQFPKDVSIEDILEAANQALLEQQGGGTLFETIHTPQCTQCGENMGCFRCAVLDEIPGNILTNQLECPFLQMKEQED